MDKRKNLAKHAVVTYGGPEEEDKLLDEASKITPRTVSTRGARYKEHRRWVRALGLVTQCSDHGKSFKERVASSKAMQLMVRLVATVDSAGVALPEQIVSRLPKQLREPGSVSRLGLGSFRREGDTVESLLALAKTTVWKDLE